MITKINFFFIRNKAILKYIFIIFLLSRLILTIVGVTSKLYFRDTHKKAYTWDYSRQVTLSIWGVWDSGFYLDLAKRGYSNDQNFKFPVSISSNSFGKYQTNYGFFPLYSVLIKIFSIIVPDFFVAGIFISNIALLITSFFLYKIVRGLSDEPTAKRSVKYLYLFPTAFVLSGVFSESLLLMLILASLYFAENKRFIISGIMGGAAVLTKLIGIFILIPVIIKTYKRNYTKIVYWVGLFIIPFTFLILLTYFFLISGNFFKYFEVKSLGWGANFQNPIQLLNTISDRMKATGSGLKFYSVVLIFIFSELLLLIVSFKKIPAAYWLFWLILFLINITNGLSLAASNPRNSVILFPQFIFLSFISKNIFLDKLLTSVFILAQLFFMALWVNGLVII